jgi:hypothetical protein
MEPTRLQVSTDPQQRLKRTLMRSLLSHHRLIGQMQQPCHVATAPPMDQPQVPCSRVVLIVQQPSMLEMRGWRKDLLCALSSLLLHRGIATQTVPQEPQALQRQSMAAHPQDVLRMCLHQPLGQHSSMQGNRSRADPAHPGLQISEAWQRTLRQKHRHCQLCQ